MRVFSTFLSIALTFGLSACAYHFQGQTNPFEAIGVKRIYVTQFTNETFRPGLEHLFTSAMVRELEKSRVFELVDSKKKADAILTGVVTNADANPSGSGAFTVRNADQQVATKYSAAVSCSVTLTEVGGRTIFTHAESQSKQSVGTVLLGDDGATTPLLNESEQRLSYQTLAVQMMANTYQHMTDLF